MGHLSRKYKILAAMVLVAICGHERGYAQPPSGAGAGAGAAGWRVLFDGTSLEAWLEITRHPGRMAHGRRYPHQRGGS
jgi:hypothetical protein